MDELPNRSLSTANKADKLPTLLLSNDEQRVLALYDELRDLEIKVALVKAQQSHVSGTYVQYQGGRECQIPHC